METVVAPTYKGYRYPIEVIGHAVWLYHRFALSLRDVEELMSSRGVVVTYESIRAWCATFGPDYAKKLRQRRPRPGDKWHLDEMVVKTNGRKQYLWRAVDQDGNELDILVQSRRNRQAAKRFFKKLLKGLRYVPRVLVTDKLASYGVAHRELMPSVTHRRSKFLNNRAENSHLHIRIGRESDETVQLTWSSSAVPVFLWTHPTTFRAPPSSTQRSRTQRATGQQFRDLG